MRVVLQCAGESTRWGDAHGVPKQLVSVRGERVLERTVRLIGEFDESIDVVLGVRDGRDPLWRIDGSRRASVRLDPGRAQADKVLSSEHLWSAQERTVLLFGDVYWTDGAIRRVLESEDPWVAFARFGPSEFTGCRHAELFGFAFDPEHRSTIADAARRCVDLADAGRLTNWSGGWQVYKAAAGAAEDHIVGVKSPNYSTAGLGHSIEIDDWTDDFDQADDWDRWCWHWAHADDDKRAVGHR